MGSKGVDRSPLSPRVRLVASFVIADAAEHFPRQTWVVAGLEDEDFVVAAVSGARPPVDVGTTITPDTENDLVVSLHLPNGATFGALLALGGRADEPDPAMAARMDRWAGLLTAVAGAESEGEFQSSRADAAARLAHQIELEALTDALTGVANRRAWDRALEAEERRRRRYGGPAAVVVVDLDELKHINDSQGHLHGDLVLRLVSKIIQDASRESDLVARTGGDEFAILALNCEEPQLRILLSRVRKALASEGVSASVGGACRQLSSGMAEAWAEADEMMFEEKARRKAEAKSQKAGNGG